MAKTEKIFDMLELIYKNPGAYDAKELAMLCGVSERGIYRYINSLANAGVTVHFDYTRMWLFNVGLEYQVDLDNANAERLRPEFEKNGISLSQSPAVSIEEKSSKWRIVDGQIYKVKKRVGRLDIYQQGGYKLLGPYWKKVLEKIGPEECKAIKALIEAGMETCTNDQVIKHGEELLKLLNGRASKWQSI